MRPQRWASCSQRPSRSRPLGQRGLAALIILLITLSVTCVPSFSASASASGSLSKAFRRFRCWNAAIEEEADQKAGHEELDRGRHSTAPVPAAQPVAREELASAGPGEPQDVFEVWTRSRERAGHGRIERPARPGEEQDGGDPRRNLEAAVCNVLVRHAVARQVEEQSERQRGESRAEERTAGGACRNVKRDDHAPTLPALDLAGRRTNSCSGPAVLAGEVRRDAMNIHFNDTQSADASGETLFEVITDYANYPRFNSALVKVDVLKKDVRGAEFVADRKTKIGEQVHAFDRYEHNGDFVVERT
jgi:hypothetical protein